MVEPRARFGLIAPATCEATLVVLYRLLPASVAVVTSAMLVNRIRSDELGAESRGIDRAARELAAPSAAVIGVGRPPIAYLSGPGPDRVMAAGVLA